MTPRTGMSRHGLPAARASSLFQNRVSNALQLFGVRVSARLRRRRKHRRHGIGFRDEIAAKLFAAPIRPCLVCNRMVALADDNEFSDDQALSFLCSHIFPSSAADARAPRGS